MIELRKSEKVVYSPQGVQKMSSELTEEYSNEELLNEEYADENYVNQNYVKIPDWHMAILKERMARYESEPVEWIPWEEVEKELLDKLLVVPRGQLRVSTQRRKDVKIN